MYHWSSVFELQADISCAKVLQQETKTEATGNNIIVYIVL